MRHRLLTLLSLSTYAWGSGGPPEQPQQREGSGRSREAGRFGRTWGGLPGGVTVTGALLSEGGSLAMDGLGAEYSKAQHT